MNNNLQDNYVEKFEYLLTMMGIECYTMTHNNGFTNLNKNLITKRTSMNTFRELKLKKV